MPAASWLLSHTPTGASSRHEPCKQCKQCKLATTTFHSPDMGCRKRLGPLARRAALALALVEHIHDIGRGPLAEGPALG
eukprot:5647609-Lingulodinium_polyedra.AAC.1